MGDQEPAAARVTPAASQHDARHQRHEGDDQAAPEGSASASGMTSATGASSTPSEATGRDAVVVEGGGGVGAAAAAAVTAGGEDRGQPPQAQQVAAEVPSQTEGAAESYEEEHVHSVYESIAPHFSSTRYKPWPFVAEFLLGLAPGSVGLDVGCGNGKYLGVNPAVHFVGSDRSASLVRFARDHGGARARDVAVADGLALPFRKAGADFAICIAVIHHMSTRERRQEAIRALLDCVRGPDAGGQILVYVWALEQSNSRRGWDEGSVQDQLVPWIMRGGKTKKPTKPENAPPSEEPEVKPDVTYQRYYHLYREGELEEDIVAAGGVVTRSGYEKDNWWVIAQRIT